MLNLAVKSHWKYSTAQNTEFAVELFALSQSIESDEIIASYEDQNPLKIRGELFSIPTNDLQASANEKAAEAPLEVVEMPAKYRPSDAYQRIRRSGVYASGGARRRPLPPYASPAAGSPAANKRASFQQDESSDESDGAESDSSEDESASSEQEDINTKSPPKQEKAKKKGIFSLLF